MKRNHQKIFWGCLVTSLFFHVTSLIFFERYSLWFSPFKKVTTAEEWLTLFDKKERHEILKEALEPKPSRTSEKPRLPQTETPVAVPSSLALKTQLPAYEASFPIHFQAPLPSEQLLDTHPFLAQFSTLTKSFPLLDHLPKDLLLPSSPQSSSSPFSPKPVPISMPLKERTLTVEEPLLQPTPISSQPTEWTLAESLPPPKSLPPIQVPHLPKLPSLAELDTASYSDSFDIDLSFIPKEEGLGYIFALTLIPRPDLELPKIRQHFTFLIDRSNSIQQGRLTATKSALHKVLEELSTEDTFNIIAFDSKVEKMAPTFLPCVGASLARAEAFIETIQLGSFFASGDLSKPLLATVPSVVESDEIYTNILLTDGETLSKKQIQKTLLYDWTRYNSGKVSLYAISLNSDLHLSTLETATWFNKGKLSLAPTNRGLKRKLLKLMKTIHHPVAKNLVCNAISRSPHTHVQLFAQPSQMPHLYLDQPYVILGEVDSLDDFILFVQGRLKNRWLNIKKTISFMNGRKGNKTLKQEWALQQALQLYQQYLQNDDPQCIAEAARILEPFDYPVAFQ